MKWRISYGFWSWKLINYAKVIMFKEMYSGLVFWLLLKNFIFYGKCHDWLLNLTKFRIIWSSWNSGLCLNVSTFKSCFYSYICESSLCAPVNVSVACTNHPRFVYRNRRLIYHWASTVIIFMFTISIFHGKWNHSLKMHSKALKELCRLCCNSVSTQKQKRSAHSRVRKAVTYKDLIMICYGIVDISNDNLFHSTLDPWNCYFQT